MQTSRVLGWIGLSAAAVSSIALAAEGAGLSIHLPQQVSGSSEYNYRVSFDGSKAEVTGDGVDPTTRSLAGLDRITVAGSPADDTLTVALAAEVPNLEIFYDGRTGFDTLVIEGSAKIESVTYAPGPGNDEGILSYQAGARRMTIRFAGLEPVVDGTTAPLLTVNATNDANVITYTDSPTQGPTWGRVAVDGFEVIDFQNKAFLDINGLDGADTFHLENTLVPSSLTSVRVYGDDGTDTFNIKAAPTPTTANGNDNSDTFNVSSDAPANMGSLDGNVQGITVNGHGHDAGTTTLTIKGAGNTLDSGDTLNISDAGDTDASTYRFTFGNRFERDNIPVLFDTIETINLSTSTAGAFIDIIDMADGINLGLTTQDADDVILFRVTGNSANITVDTAGGADDTGIETIGTNTFLRANGGSGDDLLDISTASAGSRIELNGEAGADLIEVRATAATSLVNLNGGANNDTFNVPGSLPLGSDSLDDILGPVCVNGDAHDASPTTTLTIQGGGNTLATGDILNVSDSADVDDHTYTLTATTLNRTGAATITYGTIETLNVTGAQGAEDVDVLTTVPSVNTTFTLPDNATAENDDIDVTTTGAGANVILNIGGGSDTVDIATTGLSAFTQITAVQDGVTANLLATGLASRTELNSHFGVDTVNVRTTAATSLVNIFTGLNSDTINLSSDAPANTGTLDGFLGNVVIDANSCDPGSMTLTIKGFSNTRDICNVLNISDLGDTGASTYTLDGGLFARTGIATIDHKQASVNLWTGTGSADVDVVATRFNITTITTQGQADDIDIDDLSIASSTIINTAGGNDQVDINMDSFASRGAFLQVNSGSGNDVLTVLDTDQESRIQLNGEGGADTINVRKVTFQGLVDVTGGANTDTINVSSDAPVNAGSLETIDGQVCIDGGDHDPGTTTLTIDGVSNTLDSGDILNLSDASDVTGAFQNYLLTASSFQREAEPTIDYATIETLNITTAAVPSNIDIQNTAVAVNTNVMTQDSDDDIDVMDTGTDSSVVVATFGGRDDITVDDAGIDGSDSGSAGAFLLLFGGADSDIFDYTDGSATSVPTGPADGFVFPTQAQRIEYSSFENFAVGTDWGDAPSTYPTTAAANGARHGGAGALRLGSTWDSETDGQPGSGASGDGSDEDGVTVNIVVLGADSAGGNVDVTASGIGRVDAWLDFNHDGDWDDSGEQIFTSRTFPAGTVTRTFNTTGEALPGQTYTRFRLSNSGGLAPAGPALDGEVEDYEVTIQPVDDLFLQNRVESTTRTFWACDSITAGDLFGTNLFRVLAGAEITFHAENLATFANGTEIEVGGELTVVLGGVPGCP